jgi:hypothetical protein
MKRNQKPIVNNKIEILWKVRVVAYFETLYRNSSRQTEGNYKKKKKKKKKKIFPFILWTPGASSLGIKLPGREADPSPQSSAEVKNAWNYTSPLPIRLHGVVLS